MLAEYLRLPRPVYILCAGMFVNRAGSFLLPFLALYLDGNLKLGTRFAASAISFFGLGTLVASVLGGFLADRVGRRPVMLASLLGSSAVLAFFGFLTQRWQIGAAILGFAMLSEMYRPAAFAMISDLVPADRRPAAYGLNYIAVNLGFAVAPLVGGIIAQYSFLYLFWLDAATSAIFAVIIFVTIADTLHLAAGAAAAETAAAAPARAGADAPVPVAAAARHILHNRPFLRFGAAQFFVVLIFIQAFTTFPLYLSSLGFSTQQYGRVVALNGLLITLFQIPTTHAFNRFDRARVLSAASVVLGVGFAAKALAVAPWQFALTVAIWTIGEMMQSALVPSVTSDLAPPAMRGRYFGALSLFFATGAMVAPLAGGWVLDRFGGRALWMATGVSGLVAAALFYSVRRALPPRRHVSTAHAAPTIG